MTADGRAETGRTDREPHHGPPTQRLYDSGFTDLVPIIPPTAPLSEQSAIDPAQRGKIPGRINAQKTWGGYDWLHAATDLAMLARCQAAGAGIGVVCRRVIGIDIDIDHKWLAALVVRTARECLGPAPLRTGNAPRGLLVYAVDASNTINGTDKLHIDYDGSAHTLELRAGGQQFVAYGEHPATGNAYTWDTELTDIGRDGLTVVDADGLARLFDAVETAIEIAGGECTRRAHGSGATADRGHVDQHELATDDTADMADIVAALPNTTELFPTREDYIRVGHAIKAAFANNENAGRDAWLDWCARWDDADGCVNDPDTATRDWDRMHPPFEIGARWLREHARAYGGYNDAGEAFAGQSVSEPADEPATQTEADSEPATERTGVAFWDRYVWVEEQELFCDLERRQLLSPTQFSRRLAPLVGGVTTGKNAPAELYLTNGAKRRVVDTLTYRPRQSLFLDEGERSAVNTWRPGPARLGCWLADSADDADIAPWLALASTLFPDDRERELLFDWLAWQIQHEGEKCNWHIVLRGEEGVGKDTLLQPVFAALGDGERGNAASQPAAVLQKDYTYWIEDKSLIVLQEVHTFERRSIADALKPLLAAPPEYIEIRRLHQNGYAKPNIANCVFLTNHDDAMVISETDRRLMVLACAWGQADVPDDYFTRLYAWLDNGGAQAVAAWLGHRDLSRFNARGIAPMTDAKQDMQGLSLGVAESALLDAIDEQQDIFSADTVELADIRAWLNVTLPGVGAKISTHRLRAMLRQIGATQLPRRRVDGERKRLWRVRPLKKGPGRANGAGGDVSADSARDSNVVPLNGHAHTQLGHTMRECAARDRARDRARDLM